MLYKRSFYYDPYRQGYDTNLWKTLQGAPSVVLGRLIVNHGEIIHYGDIMKGMFEFNLNIPSGPGTGDVRLFGLYQPSANTYLYFSIGATMKAMASDGEGHTSEQAITWSADWAGSDIEYVIKWEAGSARFYINGTQVAILSGDSIPRDPMSLYILDDSDDNMTVGDIDALGIHFFLLNLKSADTSSWDGHMFSTQFVAISENVQVRIPKLVPSIYQLVSVLENQSILSKMSPSLFVDSVTVSENAQARIPKLVPSVSQAVGVSDELVAFVNKMIPSPFSDAISAGDVVEEGYIVVL